MATTLTRFPDRAAAGRILAERLRDQAGRDDVVVLGLPRGGVPVASEVARALGKALVERLGLPPEWIEAIDARERRELERRQRAYRGDRPPPDLTGRTVILVDDGLATGATMLAAIRAVREEDPARVVVAVPVADPEVCARPRSAADEVVCALTPRPLAAVGAWYDDFTQTTDGEVRDLLSRSRRPPEERGPAAEHALRPLRGTIADDDELVARAMQRAIGVVYRPRPSASPTTSTRGSPASSTRSSTSTGRRRSSRWSARASGTPASCRRPTRPASRPASRG